jgi:hypothetical protein
MGYMSEAMDRARHRISVADNRKMTEDGIRGEKDRVVRNQ